MKNAPSIGGFGPDYVGWSVPVVATAYVMANSYDEAKFKVEAGLRKQARIMLIKLDVMDAVQSDAPETIENIGYSFDRPPDFPPSTPVAHARAEEVAVVAKAAVKDVPPCKFCDVHKRDINKSRTPCTPGQECHADYWRTALKGGK